MLPKLAELTGPDAAARGGAKAATLARLSSVALPVPDAFVVEAAYFDQWYSSGRDPQMPPELAVELRFAIEHHFGDARVAVRSSAADEDQPDASFAGQYTSVIDVKEPAQVVAAVLRCWRSAIDMRVAAYQAHLAVGAPGTPHMAVLVQRLVNSVQAGVAFTADPLTGDRSVTVISAVRGAGERLVAGEATANEWVVRGEVAECRVASERALEAPTAVAVAKLARRVEAHLGYPVDVEWAIDEAGVLWLLQARPITSLPDATVRWEPPGPGGWSRTFRFGEWLGEPVSPLAASWLLPVLDDQFWAQLDRHIGLPFRPTPSHALVHGWFYASMNFWNVNPARVVWQLIRRRSAWRLLAAIDPARFPRSLEYWLAGWRTALPLHHQRVADAEQRLDALALPALLELVEDLARAAGEYFVWIGFLGGAAYKTEVPLADFYRRQLSARIGGSHQRLLAGLSTPSRPAAHAVISLDWVQPTLGELAHELAGTSGQFDSERLAHVAAERARAEQSAQTALTSQPRLGRRFDSLLKSAQRAARLRDEVVEPFTLGWPTMRRALLRAGDLLVAGGAITGRDDVFFLVRQEIEAAAHADTPAIDLRSHVAARRQLWDRQRRLVAPQTLGRGWLLRGLMELADHLRDRTATPADGRGLVAGLPASPGRVTGAVRVIHDPSTFAELRAGEVLVAPATTPAWSILFSQAAAVVTDTGSPLAHASLVAREFGIPAVVATGSATRRLRTGQLVTVDGSAGYVLAPLSQRR
jgi:rifampicin phosphotransferase